MRRTGGRDDGRHKARRRAWLAAATSPFTTNVPKMARDRLLMLQASRLDATIPLLCLTVMANAVAMALAVLGDLPWWQQLAPPAIIVLGGACILLLRRWKGPAQTPEEARRQLTHTLMLAIAQGLVSGLWCVNAFTETERYYCMVAPVFIGIAALVQASCLLSVPRAAIAGIAATLLPIIIKLATWDNLGLRAMAGMLVVVGIMQSGVVLAKFRETVATLVLEMELERQAQRDSLTGIGNRLAFMTALDAAIASGRSTWLLLADLDGFKAINDVHGHGAGDDVLVAVAQRMRVAAPDALVVARLGGDEFALLFGDAPAHGALIDQRAAALALGVTAPIERMGHALKIGISVGAAVAPIDGTHRAALLNRADERLYADKNRRRLARGARLTG